jgi:superfamily II DNA or RNA helicase
MTRTKKESALNLHDRLSQLTIEQAENLLGTEGRRLIIQGGKIKPDPDLHTFLEAERFRFIHPIDGARVTVTADAAMRHGLRVHCSDCTDACEHSGTALAFLLEEKVILGLAAPPPERVPVESLNEKDLVAQALRERRERADAENMRIRSLDASTPWADYLVTSANSGKTYRVALRGWEPGQSFCSCPDFRKNTLGTCKHILKVIARCEKKFSATVRAQAWKPDRVLVSVAYGRETFLRVEIPEDLPAKDRRILVPFTKAGFDDGPTALKLLAALQRIERAGHETLVYPDAEEFIARVLHQHHVTERMAAIRRNLKKHPLRRGLLGIELLPYQLDGIAFAAGAGRAILADDMGLGKTIQGIGTAEMLARESGISKVLVICPASLKSQWANEIKRFCGRSCQIVAGPSDERAAQYAGESFFTVCNYEQVLRDLTAIEATPWDLIILDEAQRIKNWEAKTSATIKSLRSPYALVLTGTPLENRLDELFSVIEFIDDRRLGPAFRFFNRHRVIDEKGKVLGYKNLESLRATLKPIMLRRTRTGVLGDLPPRTTEIVRIEPTGEQAALDHAQMLVVASIVRKKFLTEMDLRRMQKALLSARMGADSTYLVDKEAPGFSSKLERLRELLAQLAEEPDRKIVLFSEWTTMLDLIEHELEALGLRRVRLDGSVPQKKRQQLVNEFQTDPECRLFITTNAGSTGLNLQAANTVINVDLPWNPALLEQRIGRAHRMGQKRHVHVYILVTTETIEERLLATLSAKHELANAVLDPDSDIDKVDMASGIEELKRRLEVLLGAKSEAPLDQSAQNRTAAEAEEVTRRRERVAEAGGQLLGAAFGFLAEMLPGREAAPDDAAAATIRASLAQCLETGDDGKPKLTVTLPDAGVLEGIVQALARLMPPPR